MHKIFAAVLLAVFCLSITMPALAVQKLNFDAPLSTSEKRQILTYIKSHITQSNQDIKISPIDLNQDGISEYIVKTTSCRANNLCTYVLLANDGNNMLNLGQFDARDVALGNADSSSLREIFVFNDKASDFAYNIYRWNTEQNRYEMTPAKD